MRPTSVEPVKATLSMPAWPVIGAPVWPSPVTMFRTPFGSPASRAISASASAVRGVFGGLQHHGIAGRPAPARPSRPASAAGKFHGITCPQTPCGSAPGNRRRRSVGPAGVVIEMADDQRNVDVAAFADRLAVIQRLQHRQQAGVLLDMAGQRVKMPRPVMARQRRPFGPAAARAALTAASTSAAHLRDAGDDLTRGGFVTSKGFAGRVKAPSMKWPKPS